MKSPKNKKKTQKAPVKAAPRNFEISLNEQTLQTIIACLLFASIGESCLDAEEKEYAEIRRIASYFAQSGIKLPKWIDFHSADGKNLETEEETNLVKAFKGKIRGY
jgi:hypothetical protein